MRTVRIGSGAGYSGDRIEPAVELCAKGDIQYLGFECLAERTIALAQQERMQNPAAGFDPLPAFGPASRAELQWQSGQSIEVLKASYMLLQV